MPARLADLLFWTAVVACVVAEVFILRAAFARPSAPAEGVPAARRPAEIVWAVLPAAALALVLLLTWRAMHRPAPLAAPGAAPSAPAGERTT